MFCQLSEIGQLSTPHGLERSHSLTARITAQELLASLRARHSAFSSVTPTDPRDPDPQTHFPQTESVRYEKKKVMKKKDGGEGNQTRQKRIKTLGFTFPSL